MLLLLLVDRRHPPVAFDSRPEGDISCECPIASDPSQQQSGCYALFRWGREKGGEQMIPLKSALISTFFTGLPLFQVVSQSGEQQPF